MKKIIGFAGLPGSGKTTALKGVKDLGRIINMGDVVRDEAKKRNKPINGENLGKIAKELREKFGEGIIAHRCINLINNIDTEIIFIDGIRSEDEIAIFKKKWKFPVIAIILGEDRRRELILDRARSDDPLTKQEIIIREKREERFGIKKVIEYADHRIFNISSKNELKKKTRKLVKKIIHRY